MEVEQLTDTQELEDSRKLHNASITTVYTGQGRNITTGRRAPNKSIPEFTAVQLARFWSKVEIGEDSDCWLWKGAKAPAPYSETVFYGNHRGFKVHRLAYTFLVGPIPEGLTLDHVKARGCTNTLCCNPAHLEPITQTEQIIRRDGAKSVTRKTVCKWGHPRPVGRKAKCAECNRMNARLFRERHPERARELSRQSYARNHGDAVSFAPSSPAEPGLESGEYQ